jgi:alkanesulfonate monooxygenase SsuD/methylene tetrahydromethanopterin reductase-like flavin-dependent oxidoreductase (luciferase family)
MRTPVPGYPEAMRIGSFLSCEEYGPAEQLEQAAAAEGAGFDALWISDH